MRFFLLLSLLCLLPGCVVWEIRDEMRGVNTRLDAVDTSLADVQDGLSDIEVQLSDVRATIDDTNGAIGNVQGRLGRTNTSLSSVDEQLALLRSIETSLEHLDAHLASLRKTINRIDGAIPFFSLGGDEVVEEPVAEPAPEPGASDEEADANSAPDAAPGQPSDEPQASPPARTRRDPLVGVWVSAHPSDGVTLVLQPEFEYLFVQRDETGTVMRSRGKWTRAGDALTLTPTTSTPPTNNPATPAPSAQAWTIVLQTTRSLTVDDGERILVLVKP